MKRNVPHEYRSRDAYAWLKWTVIALATLVLCSCRMLPSESMNEAAVEEARQSLLSQGDSNQPAAASIADDKVDRQGSKNQETKVLPAHHFVPAQAVPALPSHAWTGEPYGGGSCPCCPPRTRGNWVPPGLPCPWPQDEYICDGGDRDVPVVVDPDWTVRGINSEDTVVHYDTEDGRTEVAPSNSVCIYAPRFAAVRKIYGFAYSEQRQRLAGVEYPERMNLHEETAGTGTVNNPLQPGRFLGTKLPTVFQEDVKNRTVDNRTILGGLENAFKPYEDLNVIRHGDHLLSEKVRLADSIEAALEWSDPLGVQVMVDGVKSVEKSGSVELGETFTYDSEGKSRVRIIKVASKHNARPGDIVEFTLRFDNVGDQRVGNVTILDNLTTRLEYVEGSQQCSLNAEFFTIENEGESLILRWEIAAPLEVNDGGIVRFKCRVR